MTKIMKKIFFPFLFLFLLPSTYAWNPMKVGDKFPSNRILLDSDGELTSFEDLLAEGRPVLVAANTTNCPYCDVPNSNFGTWMNNNPNDRVKMTVIYSVTQFNQSAKMGYSNVAKNGTDKGFVNDWRNRFPGYQYARGFADNYCDQFWFPDEQGSTPYWWAMDPINHTFAFRGGGGESWEATKNFILEQYTNGIYTAYTTQCAAPTVTVANSTNQATVTVSNIASGSTVHYTTDGSIPTESSPVYTAPVVLKMSTLLRVQARKANSYPSKVILRPIKITTSNEINVATTGTAYSWNNPYLTANLSNETKVARVGLNDNNTTTDVKLVTTASTPYADMMDPAWQYATWQGGGVVWANPVANITRFEYYQGTVARQWWGAHGVYQYNIKLELTTDGTTWVDASKWGYINEFPYSSFYGDVSAYPFPATQFVPSSDTPITFFLDKPTTIRGFRIMGGFNVNTNYGQSEYVNVRELKAFQNNSLITDLSPVQPVATALVLYPNPALDELKLDLGSFVSELSIKLFDSQGCMLISKTAQEVQQIESLNIGTLSGGVYFLKVIADGKEMNSKFVKK